MIKRELDTVQLMQTLTKGKGFIAGGFARYCLDPAEPLMAGDIDIFTRNEEEHAAILSSFTEHTLMQRTHESLIETKWDYKLKTGFKKESYSIQLINPVRIENMVGYGTIDEVLASFDFTIIKAAIDLADLQTYTHEDFAFDNSVKELIIENIHCPISTMGRVVKYTKKGFSCPNKELLKLFSDYEKRTPEWKELIRRGLTSDDIRAEKDFDADKFIQAMYFD